MPRVRRGPGSPKRSAAGKKGTNKMARGKGPGKSHERYMASKATGGYYS
jgi:hypothetical protein